jgi:hypothetical protein
VKEVLSYLTSIAGFGLMMFVFSQIAGRPRYMFEKMRIIHLLRTMPNQAELVCRVAKGSFTEAIGASMKTLAMMKSKDPNVVTQGSKPGYDAALPMIKMYWGKQIKRGRAALGLSIAGVVLAFVSTASAVLQILLLLATIGAAVYAILYKLDVDRSLMLARLEVLPEVERAFVEGRYVLPP